MSPGKISGEPGGPLANPHLLKADLSKHSSCPGPPDSTGFMETYVSLLKLLSDSPDRLSHSASEPLNLPFPLPGKPLSHVHPSCLSSNTALDYSLTAPRHPVTMLLSFFSQPQLLLKSCLFYLWPIPPQVTSPGRHSLCLPFSSAMSPVPRTVPGTQ